MDLYLNECLTADWTTYQKTQNYYDSPKALAKIRSPMENKGGGDTGSNMRPAREKKPKLQALYS